MNGYVIKVETVIRVKFIGKEIGFGKVIGLGKKLKIETKLKLIEIGCNNKFLRITINFANRVSKFLSGKLLQRPKTQTKSASLA